MTDFYKALGLYQLYYLALNKRLPDTVLYLAIPEESYSMLIKDDILAEFLEELSLKYIIFNPEFKQIIQWIN